MAVAHRWLACVFALVAVLHTGALRAATPAARASTAQALHLLNRLAFGPRPGDVARVQAMGMDAYIEQQLHPDRISLPASLQARLARFDTLQLSPVELFREYGPPRRARGEKPDAAAAKAARQRARVIVQQAAAAHLLRAIDSPRQLQEVMVDFWLNHFNVFAGKGLDHLWIGAYEQQAIRPYALGKFRDLLGATAKHPAMLFYLDNWQNTAPDSPAARGHFDGLNENYAREVMELHTLGVSGGYTQQDVISLARIFTGWGLDRRGRQAGDGNGFHFDARRHDFSDKTFLGHTIRGRGEQEGEEALDILASSPATAHHISYELAQYFVADRPAPALVDALAQRYLATDGDIRAVLETLFHSRQFWAADAIGNKFKTPFQYVVSAVRAGGIEVSNVRPLVGMLWQLGMPLYGCQTPDGYKNTQSAWLNPDAMTRRLSFATALGAGYLPLDRPEAMVMVASRQQSGAMREMATPGKAAPHPIDAQHLAQTLGDAFSTSTRAAVQDAPPRLRAALLLGSPEFMHR